MKVGNSIQFILKEKTAPEHHHPASLVLFNHRSEGLLARTSEPLTLLPVFKHDKRWHGLDVARTGNVVSLIHVALVEVDQVAVRGLRRHRGACRCGGGQRAQTSRDPGASNLNSDRLGD